MVSGARSRPRRREDFEHALSAVLHDQGMSPRSSDRWPGREGPKDFYRCLGGDRAVAAARGSGSWPMVGSSPGARRHRVQVPHRSALERPARTIPPLANRPRTLRPLGSRRHLRPPLHRRPDTGRSGLAGRDRFHDRPGPPARRCQRGLEDRGLGRSRGGLTSKVHLACDGRGRPLAFLVTAGTRSDWTQAETIISRFRVPRPGPGRPRPRPDTRRHGQGLLSPRVPPPARDQSHVPRTHRPALGQSAAP